MGAPVAPKNSYTAGSITISGYWARMAVQVGGVSAAYMEIRSSAETDTLIRAESSVANAVELHETTMNAGVMAMSPVPNMAVPPRGDALILKPAGLHVMLIDLKKPMVVGDFVDLDLYFHRAGKISIKVPVLAP
jgi:copper(I)-binding protein